MVGERSKSHGRRVSTSKQGFKFVRGGKPGVRRRLFDVRGGLRHVLAQEHAVVVDRKS